MTLDAGPEPHLILALMGAAGLYADKKEYSWQQRYADQDCAVKAADVELWFWSMVGGVGITFRGVWFWV